MTRRCCAGYIDVPHQTLHFFLGTTMGTTVCLYSNALAYPHGGGHLWVYLNWALALRALGADVIWLEDVGASPSGRVHEDIKTLRRNLAPYGFDTSLSLVTPNGTSPAGRSDVEVLEFEVAAAADLLLNLGYNCRREVVGRFRRSAMIDIDPGLVQVWMEAGQLAVCNHDVYFTTGETVGQAGGRIPDGGLTWHYTPPPVFLPAWTYTESPAAGAYTTVTHWYHNWEMVDGEPFDNSKRASFLDYLGVAERTAVALELAVHLEEAEQSDRELLERHGWRVRDAHRVAGDPSAYRRYVADSRGEFSCAKPSCMRLQNAWVSDRTLCYLASGKPAVVQHTGPSRILPDAEGVLRFRDPDEAVRHLIAVENEHDRHSAAARALAEEHYDAVKVVGRVLERALP